MVSKPMPSLRSIEPQKARELPKMRPVFMCSSSRWHPLTGRSLFSRAKAHRWRPCRNHDNSPMTTLSTSVPRGQVIFLMYGQWPFAPIETGDSDIGQHQGCGACRGCLAQDGIKGGQRRTQREGGNIRAGKGRNRETQLRAKSRRQAGAHQQVAAHRRHHRLRVDDALLGWGKSSAVSRHGRGKTAEQSCFATRRGCPKSSARHGEPSKSTEIDGVLYVTMYHRIVDLVQDELPIPTVLINCRTDRQPTLPSITPNDYQGSRDLTRYILEQGHKQDHLHQAQSGSFFAAEERYRAFGR